MTLRHMKIFISVCKEKSITIAAKKLYISQPAVSNAIKELESYYGTPLFDRISKKIYLTETGKTVYQYAIHINSLFDELDAAITSSEPYGQLRIGSSITIGTHLMPDFVRKFTEQYPFVQTYITVDSSDIIEKNILDNELDFALIEGIVHSEHLISKDFIEDELVVVCDKNHELLNKKSVSLQELFQQKFLMREKNSGTREFAESILAVHNFFIAPIWESSSTEAIIQAVSKGIGISILPLQLVQDYIDRNQIAKIQVAGIQFKRKYHIIYHKNKFLTPYALKFIELCDDYRLPFM